MISIIRPCIRRYPKSVGFLKFNAHSSVTNWKSFSISHRILSKKGPTLDDVLKDEPDVGKKKIYIDEKAIPFQTRLAAVSVVSALVGAFLVLSSDKKGKR